MKNSNNIQIRVDNLMCTMNNVTSTRMFDFTARGIIYLVLWVISSLFLNLLYDEMNSAIFHRCNKSASTVINILISNILYVSIVGCKALAYKFQGILMIAHVTFAPLDAYSYYSNVECLVFFTDSVLTKIRYQN